MAVEMNNDLKNKLNHIADIEKENSFIGVSFAVKNEHKGVEGLLTSDVVDYVTSIMTTAVDLVKRRKNIPFVE